MGKSLIIKDADFSDNALDNIIMTDITSGCVFSGTGRKYIHYPSNNQSDTFLYVSSLSTTRIASLDVTQYRGETIVLRVWDVSDSSVSGAWFICFASSVSVSLPWTGSTTTKNVLTAIEHTSGQGSSKYTVVTLEVPQTASYLIFNDITDHLSSVYLKND